MAFSLLRFLLVASPLALRAAGLQHGHLRHGHHPHVARTVASVCIPTIVTETVYVTADCPDGQCPAPTPGPSSSGLISESAPPPVDTPAAPPLSSSAGYDAPPAVPPSATPESSSAVAPPPPAPPLSSIAVYSAPPPPAQPSSSSAVSSVPAPPPPAPSSSSIAAYSAPPLPAQPSSSSAVFSVPAPPPPAPSSSSIAAYSAPPPPAHPLSSNAVSYVLAPSQSAPPASAERPQPTVDSSLLCPHVESQAMDAGTPIPPMPFGAHLDASVATYNPLPTLAAAICQAPDNFHKITTIPNHGSIKNSCNYEVYVSSFGCGGGAQHELIPAGQTWSEPLRSCPAAQGTLVYKVTKADEPSKPVQFEVGLTPDEQRAGQENSVWYDISFLDCMVENSTDLSACPGWEGGVQCVPGKQGCQVFVCGAGEYCDGSAYTTKEFGLDAQNEAWRKKAGAPVSSCETRQEGIAFELCATT
ncbi:hypothetical protein BU23DRAFT_556349 [Bimuria novae-zelandiae CBS 107.79]|uniref:Uncharacterized protein n=1 Tax=Bimuria novae-zelandiae CBS 107.79 TaxID=1447943 RepID=A0A6A5V4T2_9PLEO|nr:hypothetical protein BU23DRAFT_556349 [Bimuria novae-zelandiae CBS 107.79]